MSYRIGVDLGGTNIAAGIVDENGRILQKRSMPTLARTRTEDEIAAAMADLCHDLLLSAGISTGDVAGIGVAAPGIVDPAAGQVIYICNLPFSRYDLAGALRRRTGIPSVHVENDANAAAWGERLFGAAKGTRHSLLVTLGTGVGVGVIIDGRIYDGFNHAAAEPGHMVIREGGVRCACGRRGCFEVYASATALIRMTRAKMTACRRKSRPTLLFAEAGKEGKVTGRTAFSAMRAGDAAAREVTDAYIRYLAVGVTNLVNIFQPEVLAIGGGVSGEGRVLLDPLVAQVRTEQYGGDCVPSTRIVPAELGNDAGIIGAAFLGD